jgi:predicted permease
MAGFLQDMRYAARGLRKTPAFTLVVVLTLALGIGATTAMFSVVNGVLLRPLPYPHQDRIVELVHEAPGIGPGELFASPAMYFAYRDYSRTFELVGLWDWDDSPVTVTGLGEPEAVPSVAVTREVLAILGATPIVGRIFNEIDDESGSPATVVVSHAYWQRQFSGGDVLGRTLVVDGQPRQIIGVLPSSFTFFDYPAEIFYPLQLRRSEAVFPSFDGRGLARLRPAVTLDQANADIARMIPILTQEFASPEGNLPADAQLRPKLKRLQDGVVGELSDTLWVLMGTIGLLMLIACANVANLVLVRTYTRRAELAVRSALGAGWSAITRVILAESAVLGAVGGALGVAVAYVSLPAVLALGAGSLPHISSIRIDSTVLLFTLGISLAAILVFALIPVLHVVVPNMTLLRAGSRSVSDGHESNRTRHVLVVSQVAVALVLLVGAALMIRTFQTLRQVDPGFRDPDNVQTFQITIPPSNTEPARTLRMQQAIAERLAAVPGVESVGFATFNDGLPMDGDGRKMSILPTVGGPLVVDGVTRVWELQRVSPGFVETLRTPVIAGRTFTWNDIYSDNSVMLVSENLAQKEWGSATAALGKRLFAGPSNKGSQIIGVIKDVHHEGVNQPAPDTAVFRAVPSDIASFVVRSERAGTIAFVRELRTAVWSVNGSLSLANVKTLGEMYQRSIARTSMTLQLLMITSTMALLLGLVGIYGVVSYAISQRRREIGIRVALGARHAQVRRMFVKQAFVLVGIGVVTGLGAAMGLTRLMESQLFGVTPLDPASYLTVAVVLMVTALVASYMPARRAARIDPLVALRYE